MPDTEPDLNPSAVNELLRETQRELIAALQKLASANRSRSDLLDKMSHELRTPMTAIVGMTDLLLLGELSDEHRDCLCTVRDAADNLMELLDDVCDYARIEAGTLEFEWVGFRLPTLIAETVRKLAPAAQDRQIELVVGVSPDVPAVVVADPHRVGQIVHNLVHNAIRMTKAGEVVLEVGRVSETADEVVLRFTVRDTGVGIAAEDQQRLFLPFMSTDRSLRRRYPLTAMGLPLTAALVSALGGRLSVHSEIGSGTYCEADVRVLKQPVSSTLYANQPGRAALHGRRVLVVSPNASQRRVLGQTLGSWGMQPILASDADSAVAKLDFAVRTNSPITFTLVDSALPREDWQQIRHAPTRDGRMILLAPAVGETLDARQCEILGVDAIIRKPIFERELVETLLTTMRGLSPEPSGALTTGLLRILVVEAAPVNRALTVRLLAKKGHVVAVADRSAEAIARLAIESDQLVLLDSDLVGADEVAVFARQRGIPVVQLNAAPADDGIPPREPVLSRPLDAAQLYRTISHVFRGHFMNESDTGGDSRCEIDAAIARLGGDVHLYKELIQSFLDDTSGLLPKIQRAVEARDADAVHRAGHSMKGLAASCGATGVADAASHLERLGRENQLAELDSYWLALECSFSATRRVLDPYYTSKSA